MELYNYVKGYLEAIDDGSFDSDDDIVTFVIDQIYAETGEDVSELADKVLKEIRGEGRAD